MTDNRNFSLNIRNQYTNSAADGNWFIPKTRIEEWLRSISSRRSDIDGCEALLPPARQHLVAASGGFGVYRVRRRCPTVKAAMRRVNYEDFARANLNAPEAVFGNLQVRPKADGESKTLRCPKSTVIHRLCR